MLGEQKREATTKEQKRNLKRKAASLDSDSDSTDDDDSDNEYLKKSKL